MLFSVKVIDGFQYPDFDKRAVKKGMRKVGQSVAKLAKSRISKRIVSKPGDPPGRKTGNLYKSIKPTVSRSGFSVRINPRGSSFAGAYYPAYVIYGHRGPGSDSKSQRGKIRSGRKVAEPRENFLVKAAEEYAPEFETTMQEILLEALKK